MSLALGAEYKASRLRLSKTFPSSEHETALRWRAGKHDVRVAASENSFETRSVADCSEDGGSGRSGSAITFSKASAESGVRPSELKIVQR